MKSNTFYNGLTIDMINKRAKTELVKVATSSCAEPTRHGQYGSDQLTITDN